MAELKVTAVEGIESFQAEGTEATVKQLLAEWRARNDALRAEARTDYENMSASLPRGPMGPSSGPLPYPAPPFPRRTS